RVHQHQLNNGVRVAWMNNIYPKQRCYVRLIVNVGSIHEQKGQEGLAHFLEHLAFRGSKAYNEKQLTDWFGQQGMEFGPDVNAYTSFDETVYMLDVPSCKKEKLQEALGMLREFASNLTLSADAVQKEQGIVDSEERMNDLPVARASKKWFNHVLQGTAYAQRHPIGKQQVRHAFTAESVRAFYHKWYAPKNTSLAIVGDLQEEDPVSLVQKAFGDWKGHETQVTQKPPVGDARAAVGFQTVYEKDLTHVSLQVSQMDVSRAKPLTVRHWLQNIPLNAAFAMLNHRLQVLQDEGKAEFLAAGFGAVDHFRLLQGVHYGVKSQPDKWGKALCQVDAVLASALQKGFFEQELQVVVKDMLNGLQQGVTERETSHSAAHLGRVHKALTGRFPAVDPRDRQRLTKPVLSKLTPKACQKALRKAWKQGQLLVQAMGGQEVGSHFQQELQKAFGGCRKRDVAAWHLREVGSFAYHTPHLKPQKVQSMVRAQHLKDVDVHRFTFANGVVLHVKQTDWQKDEVLLLLRLGSPGRLDIADPQQIALMDVWQATFLDSGLGQHNSTQLSKLLAGKTIGGSAFVGERSLGFRGSTRPKDFLFTLELMRAYMLDPAFREEGLVAFHQWLDAHEKRTKKSVYWPLIKQLIPALRQNDKRFCSVPIEKLKQVEQKQVRHWFSSLGLQHAPLDIVVVGDMPVQTVVQQIAQTFGSLRPRKARSGLPRVAPIVVGSGLSCTCLHEEAVESDVLLQVAYPIRHHASLPQEIQWELLERILQTQLWEAVRLKMGATYNIAVHAAPRTMNGHGILTIGTQVAPEKVSQVQRVIQQVLRRFAQQKPTNKQLQQARKPLLEQLQETDRTNSYWLYAVYRSLTQSDRLLPTQQWMQVAKSVTTDHIWELAKQALQPSDASLFMVYPNRVKGGPHMSGCVCNSHKQTPVVLK
ncbi:MAG: insulinase family protein, partial [Myxococcota bacterium]